MLLCVVLLNSTRSHAETNVEVAFDNQDSAAGLLPEKNLVSIRKLVRALARLGLEEEVTTLRKVLLILGDDPLEHKNLESVWKRELAWAKPNEKQLVTLGKKLSKLVGVCERALKGLESADQKRLGKILQSLIARRRVRIQHSNMYWSERNGSPKLTLLVRRERRISPSWCNRLCSWKLRSNTDALQFRRWLRFTGRAGITCRLMESKCMAGLPRLDWSAYCDRVCAVGELAVGLRKLDILLTRCGVFSRTCSTAGCNAVCSRGICNGCAFVF
ncbi:MAG: hypothetical protein ACI87A_003202 [Planctomycetota bacterium]|jgi:hypothetical protein